MNKVIGFIGCGNMAKAMIGGLIKSNTVSIKDIIASASTEKTLKETSEKYGVKTTNDNKEVAKNSDILVLAVKPNLYSLVISEVKEYIKDEVIVVSIAGGKTINAIEEMFEKRIKIVRAMPNTPVLVGEGMAALCSNHMVTKEETEEVIKLFQSFGKIEKVDEKLMEAVTAVSGSSPAYVYMFIEALADGAVLEGMPRKQAYKFAAQAVLGSAKMVLETGIHPGELKDMVCSPGGTTIEAVATLEEKGLRDAVISAMKNCVKKSQEMSK